MTSEAEFVHEPRPRDFSARLSRAHARSLRGRRSRSHFGRRGLALFAAVAVPAFAAPDEWRDFAGPGMAIAGQPELEPMPFERAGSSFPGSAFYYLAPDAPPLNAGLVHSDAEDAPRVVDPVAGPAARALVVDNSGVDRSRALQCLTAAIYYEAASEPDAGQRAVAQVVLNRVAHPSYPNTVCGVVYQGPERRTGCQFSFTCDGSLARVPARMFWLRAERVAADALAGSVYAPVGLATHYHTVAIYPYWAPSLSYLGTIGAHRFYKFGGRAGQPATFRFAYAGGEPMASPHRPLLPGQAAPAEALVDPVAVQAAYDNGLKAAQALGQASGQAQAVAPTRTGFAPVRAAPAPVYAQELKDRGGEALYTGDRLPTRSGVRPEFENSGRWIVPPGR